MKSRRHDKILELIQQREIDTQEELLNCLRDAGYDITQATVSRDIKELRLVKALSSKGKYHYSTGQEGSRDISTKFLSLFGDSVLHVEAAGNLLVIKCITGMAQAVCTAMDANSPQSFVGTLAGDDTILAICKTAETAVEKQEDLRRLMNV